MGKAAAARRRRGRLTAQPSPADPQGSADAPIDPASVADPAETVDALVALGIDEEDAEEAVRYGRVPLVLVRQLLGEERGYSLADIATEAEIDEGVLRRVFLALGTPLQDAYGPSDLDEATKLAQLLSVFTPDTLVRLARVHGMAVTRIAMGDISAIRDEVVSPMREAGADDLTVAVALAETAKSLLPLSGDLLLHAHRRALFQVLSSEVASVGVRQPGQEVDLAVGFVDLVGYTALSARVDPTGLDQVLDSFEERVFEVASEVSDVNLVKFLGDAAMLVSTDAIRLIDTLLRLVQRIDELEDAPLRAGVGAGPTLVREGDYYGAPVNLAARLTDLARPWTLLADDGLAEQLEGHYHVSRIRPVRVRGLGLRRPVSVSPLA